VNIRDELVKLQRDIEEHADDTCWCGPAETVVDRIEWMLQQYSADDQAPPSSNEFDNCLCGHRYDSHIDSDDIQGECGKNNCDCLAYRPAPEPQRPSNEQVTPVDGLIAESRAVLATHLNGTWKDDYAALRLAQMVRALLARIEETTALQRELQRARDTIDTFEMEANPRPAHEPEATHYLDGLTIDQWRAHAKAGWAMYVAAKEGATPPPSDDLAVDVAGALERIRVKETLVEVYLMAHGRTDNPAYWAGFETACDEIAVRLQEQYGEEMTAAEAWVCSSVTKGGEL
jgi:hypothetical protein